MNTYYNIDLDKLAPGQLIEPERRGVFVLGVDKENGDVTFVLTAQVCDRVEYLTDRMYRISKTEFKSMLERMGRVELKADPFDAYPSHVEAVTRAWASKKPNELVIVHDLPF